MKSIAFIVVTALFSISAYAAPSYNLSSDEVLGEYIPKDGGGCTNEKRQPCTSASIYRHNNEVFIYLEDYEQTAQLFEGQGGRLVFNVEIDEVGDCDDPGCWNLLGYSGVIYPSKAGKSYVPTIRVYIRKDYPFPDEEGAPDGNVTEIENMVKRDK